MRHSPFVRGRNGRFISQYERIAEWTGALLSSGAGWEPCLYILCEHAARWCEQVAAGRFEWAQGSATGHDLNPVQRERISNHYAADASRWFCRAALLRECAEKLKEVR